MVSFWSMIKFRFRKKEELYLSLRKILGFYPNHLYLYKQAMVHKSLGIKGEDGKEINNERLEFLGDAIIEAVVSDMVFHRFSKAREGFLTTTRSKLVQRSTLNSLSRKIGLDDLVRFTRRSDTHNSYIGGNAFEALVGAIYLDQGYKRSFWFINRLIDQGFINPETTAKKEQNFKSHLLEFCQKFKLQAEFLCVENTDVSADEQPPFFSKVVVEDNAIGFGEGYSKKESHQKAARNAVEKLRHSAHLKNDLILFRFQRQVISDVLSVFPVMLKEDGTEDAEA